MARHETTPDWRSGYEACRKQAYDLAAAYQAELLRMAVDSWMLRPARAGDLEDPKNAVMESDGWAKGEAASAAFHIKEAIWDMRP